MSSSKLILLVSKPGRIGDVLKALLRATSITNDIITAENSDDALRFLAAQQPDLVVIAADLPYSEVRIVLEYLKLRLPSVRSLVLVNKAGQHQGADQSLLTGFSASQFFETVSRLLSAHPMLVDS